MTKNILSKKKKIRVAFSGTFVNILHKIMCFFFSFRKTVNDEEHDVKDLGNSRGISILGEVRNAEISRVTQQLLCSKF